MAEPLKTTRIWGSVDVTIPVQRVPLAPLAFASVSDTIRECYGKLLNQINADTEYMTLLVEGYPVWRKRYLVPKVKLALAVRRVNSRLYRQMDCASGIHELSRTVQP